VGFVAFFPPPTPSKKHFVFFLKTHVVFFFFGGAAPPPPPVGQGLLIHEVSLEHTQRRTTVGRIPLEE